MGKERQYILVVKTVIFRARFPGFDSSCVPLDKSFNLPKI